MIAFILLYNNPTIIIQEEHKPAIETEIIEKKVEVKPRVVIVKKKPVVKKKPTVVKKAPQLINIIISYYTNSIENCGNTKGISASGKNLTLSRGGTYVAAPKNIPFKTKINVKGIGVVTVEDRGGAIKHVWKDGKQYMKLDVFVKGATQHQLEKMGIVKTTGYIIK